MPTMKPLGSWSDEMAAAIPSKLVSQQTHKQARHHKAAFPMIERVKIFQTRFRRSQRFCSHRSHHVERQDCNSTAMYKDIKSFAESLASCQQAQAKQKREFRLVDFILGKRSDRHIKRPNVPRHQYLHIVSKAVCPMHTSKGRFDHLPHQTR